MGLCYMMQYMDKLALSQATLFNLRGDLVSFHFTIPGHFKQALTIVRTFKDPTIPGPRPHSTLDTLHGAGPVVISWFAFVLANTSLPVSLSGEVS